MIKSQSPNQLLSIILSGRYILVKKFICAVLAASLVLCCVSFASAEFKFERKVSIVCPWGVGGGADSTLRPMANLLKPILGQEVEVVNVTGGNGVTAIEYVYKQPADGYTFMLGTQSLFMQDIQGTTSMNFKEEFVPVARLVHAINVITASKKAMDKKGYKTFSEMRKYVQDNPFEVSVGMLTSTGLDGASLKQALEGLDILDVSYPSGSEMNSALVGGHIDIMVTGTDEIEGLIAAGDVVPLLTLAENRMKRYPNVECSVELGINSVLGPARGIFAKKGTPQEAIDALAAAIEQAAKDPSWVAFLQQGCYDERPGFAGPAEYAAACEADYKLLTDYLKAEGVMKKDYYAK